MTSSRMLVLGGVLLTAATVAVVTVVANGDATPAPAAPSSAASAPAAKSAPAPKPVAEAAKPTQDPRCAGQDNDDDGAEKREKKLGKPDLDNVELQCGDQNDDDDEIEDRDERAAAKTPSISKPKAPAGSASKSADKHR